MVGRAPGSGKIFASPSRMRSRAYEFAVLATVSITVASWPSRRSAPTILHRGECFAPGVGRGQAKGFANCSPNWAYGPTGNVHGTEPTVIARRLPLGSS